MTIPKIINRDLYNYILKGHKKYCDRNAHGLPPLGKSWLEDDVFNGKRTKSLVIVLKTRGCEWYYTYGGCTMCGYNLDTLGGIDDIETQIRHHIDRYKKILNNGEVASIKIFNSGSLLNPKEVSPKYIDFIGKILKPLNQIKEVVIESRPEYITPENINHIVSCFDHVNIKIALGLETASDFIRINTVNKGTILSEYDSAIEVINTYGHGYVVPKFYVLLKPPFLTEWEAIADTIHTIKYAVKRSKDISINPVNVQRTSIVHHLFMKGFYRPPYLWSLLYVLLDTLPLRNGTDIRIYSSPTGAGSPFGIHNCGKCDTHVIKAIKLLSQDYYFVSNEKNGILDYARNLLQNGCECLTKWYALRHIERIGRYIHF